VIGTQVHLWGGKRESDKKPYFLRANKREKLHTIDKKQDGAKECSWFDAAVHRVGIVETMPGRKVLLGKGVM
jgi:hypothetical protein